VKLTDFATPLVAANHFIKASFGGFAGSGKTRTASEFIAGAYKDLGCTKPILIVDNEKGSRFLVPFFKKHGIEVLVKDTVTLADTFAALEYVRAGEVDFLFIDTLTKVWYQYVRDYKAKKSSKYTFMTLEDWGKILPAWQEQFSDRFVDCPGNIVFTGRGGYQYEKEEDVTDEETGRTKKGQFVKSGVKMKLAGETPFEPDINVWMELNQEIGKNGLEVWREAQVMKDRCGVIDGKVFKNPTYADFRPAIQFILGVPLGQVAGASDTANHAPSEDNSWYQRKQAREAEVEKIKAIFTVAMLGSSNEDKAIKALLYDKCLGTTSNTEFEKMDAEKLALARVKLAHFFKSYDPGASPAERLESVRAFDPTTVPTDAFEGAFAQ
jgi:hypothetical protein